MSIEKRVKEIIVEQLGVNESEVTPEAKFVDATEWVDEIKVIKSPEEIELTKGTAALQDAAMEHLKKTLKPGMRDFEAESLYNLLQSGKISGHILRGFVSLNLLLLEAQSVSKILLAQTRSDPGLDQSPRQTGEGVEVRAMNSCNASRSDTLNA
jgi:hypothetical protein